MRTPLSLAGAFLALTIPCTVLAQQAIDRIIPNVLNETWPLEHVYFEFDAAELKGPMTCTIQGITRPTQAEAVEVGGKKRVRLWTVATIGWKDEQGVEIKDRNSKDNPEGIKKVKAALKPGTAASPLTVKDEGDYLLIDNGVYEFKIRNYKGTFPQPVTLDKVPHWIGGMRVKGTEKWDGRATFQGNALIKSAKTEIVSKGPVHIDIKITLESEQAPGTLETANAVLLAVGKQSFRYAPNEVPVEKVTKLTNHYEALIRFVAEDPWVDVAQRYHFPRDPAMKPWGFSQEFVELGGKDGMPVDTAMWVRWFEWDKFGGNTDINFLPATVREEQKGRPFAMLRPLWNQGPGGAQDFFLTSGGRTPPWNNEKKMHEDPTGAYQPETPAIGIYSTFPSKWVGPFSQTIVVRAENGDSGSWRLPLVPAEDPRHGIVPGFHFGQRAFGICVGPRRMFDDTGKINGMVRRHTDWTLVALINKYLLEWPRDPAKAGPNLIVGKARLEQLRNDVKANKDTEEVRIIRAAWEGLKPKGEEAKRLEEDFKGKDEALKKLKSTKDTDPKVVQAAEAERKEAEDKMKAARKAASGEDADILNLIVDGTGKDVKSPESGLWRERRYQDDFLNPTSSSVRRLADLRRVDLFAGGKPVGGANLAAMAYIICDPDAWMGWRNGWMPGNPNFHTDKYMSALYLGGAMNDHPHAKEWIEFARQNYEADVKDVLLPPDGVGIECPGYAAYALNLLLPMATAFENLGFGNIVGNNPSFKGSGTWHRKLLTPVDARLGFRHEAPIGDTHRWVSGMNEDFAELGRFFKKTDPKFASEMTSTWRELRAMGTPSKRSDFQMVLAMDFNLPSMKMADMDWSAQSFHGFGAVMRTHFGTPRETFVSYKAGPIRGHYHNDENSYHYYALGTPVSLDYNCSYHPRGDHAVLHNSMTFGVEGTVVNNEKQKPVPAHEQLSSSARVGAFVSRPAGDLVVSERSGKNVGMSPIQPGDSEFQREYPNRNVGELVHRRLLLLVKHAEKSKMTDYLVVRDETKSAVPQQLNIHLLARDAKIDGKLVEASGQLGVDMSLFIAEGQGAESADAKIELRSWHYWDEFMFGPAEYTLQPGESIEAWDKRMDDLMKSKGVKTLPLAGFKPLYKNAQKGETAEWLKQVTDTGGQALVPPKNWTGPWQYGEYQKWVRVESKPGTPLLWVLYPYAKGDAKPKLERVDDKTVRVTHAGETEEITMDSEGGVNVKSAAGDQIILAAGKLPPLGEIKADAGSVYRGE